MSVRKYVPQSSASVGFINYFMSLRSQVLGQAMNLIRIPCMELAEFANGAAQSGILTLQETTDLFLHFTARNKPSVAYPIKPRQGLKKQICHRLVGWLKCVV